MHKTQLLIVQVFKVHPLQTTDQFFNWFPWSEVKDFTIYWVPVHIQVVCLVRLLSSNISKNCALCDKSTKFGTDVNYYNTKFFRYWATWNFASVSAILDFKLATVTDSKNRNIFGSKSVTHVILVAKHTFWGYWIQCFNLQMAWKAVILDFNKKAQLSLTNPRDAKACQNCSNSTCLQRCWWQYLSIFIRLAVGTSEICEIPLNSPKIETYRVQGHPRSSILVPIKSPCVTSY